MPWLSSIKINITENVKYMADFYGSPTGVMMWVSVSNENTTYPIYVKRLKNENSMHD